MNSSPPKRATTSAARTRDSMTAETRLRQVSPALCGKLEQILEFPVARDHLQFRVEHADSAGQEIQNARESNCGLLLHVFVGRAIHVSTLVCVTPVGPPLRQVYLYSALVAAFHPRIVFDARPRPASAGPGQRHDNGKHPQGFIAAQAGQFDSGAGRAPHAGEIDPGNAE